MCLGQIHYTSRGKRHVYSQQRVSAARCYEECRVLQALGASSLDSSCFRALRELAVACDDDHAVVIFALKQGGCKVD